MAKKTELAVMDSFKIANRFEGMDPELMAELQDQMEDLDNESGISCRMDQFQDLLGKLYERLYNEAFDPYWQRHNRWTGDPGNRWIYNDILKAFWLPGKENPEYGHWIDNKYNHINYAFTPHIGDDPKKEAATESQTAETV